MATDAQLRVEYSYLKRHQARWHRDSAPLLESIVQLTRRLRWEGTQRHPDRPLTIPLRDLGLRPRPEEPDPPLTPGHLGMPPRPRTEPPRAQRPVVRQELTSEPRQLSYLRPVMAAHERAIEFVRNRADEGVRVQYRVAERLGVTVAFYESREGHYAALMRTGELLPPVTGR